MLPGKGPLGPMGAENSELFELMGARNAEPKA